MAANTTVASNKCWQSTIKYRAGYLKSMEKRSNRLLLGILLTLGMLFLVISENEVFAQEQTNSSVPNPSQVQQCKDLGIQIENCDNMTILSKYCLGNPNVDCNAALQKIENQSTPPAISQNVTFAIVGAFIGVTAGVIFASRMASGKKGKTGTEPSTSSD